MSNKNVPQIRFKGFEGEWEEKKIRDISTSYSGGTPSVGIKEYYDGDIPFIRSGEIHDSKTELNISLLGLNNSSAKMVEKGSILYALYGATSGEVAISKIEGAINQAILAIIVKEGYNNVFVSQFLTRQKASIVSNFLQGGQGNLSGAIVKNIEIKTPADTEQTRIASLFTAIDKQISCSEAKLDKLRTIKKTLLKKMFASQGKKTPQIRFKGFEGVWEENKLNSYLEVSTEKNSLNLYGIYDVLSVSGEVGVVNQIEFQGRSFAGASVSNYGVLRTGEVTYTKSPLKSCPYGIIKANKGDTGIVSVLYGVYKSKGVNTDFVQDYFDLISRLNNYLRPLVNKGAKNTLLISDDDALEGMVKFPKSNSEQTRIAFLFTSLDKQISLQEQKIEKLKAIKKTLLKKMFV